MFVRRVERAWISGEDASTSPGGGWQRLESAEDLVSTCKKYGKLAGSRLIIKAHDLSTGCTKPTRRKLQLIQAYQPLYAPYTGSSPRILMEELGYELDRLFSAVAQDWKFIVSLTLTMSLQVASETVRWNPASGHWNTSNEKRYLTVLILLIAYLEYSCSRRLEDQYYFCGLDGRFVKTRMDNKDTNLPLLHARLGLDHPVYSIEICSKY